MFIRILGAQRRWLRFCLGFLMAVQLTSRAVDPLPPELERADPDTQQRYREKRDKESEELKIQVGQKRYDERIKAKQAILSDLVQEVKNQRAKKNSPPTAQPTKPRNWLTENFHTWNCLAFVLIFAGNGYLIKKHFFNAKE